MTKPVDQSSRIATLDVLRGFALLGVMIANMATHSGFFFLTSERAELLDRWGTDHFFEWAEHFLIDGKFYSLFSLLFGIGFALQMKSHSKAGLSIVPRFSRRLTIMFFFGLVHAILFYVGDILTVYALTGFVLLLFRNTSDKAVLRWAIILSALPVLQYLIYWIPNLNNPPAPSGPNPLFEQLLNTYTNGTITDVIVNNIGGLLFGRYPDLIFTGRFFRVLAMFLLGLYAIRVFDLNNLEKHRALLKQIMIWSLIVGLPCNYLLAEMMDTNYYYAVQPLGILQPLAYAYGVPALALFYASTVALLCLNRNTIFRVFAPVGQLALTNYLSQSVICCLIFMNYGLGLYGQVGPTILTGIGLCIFTFQIIFSHWWLRHYNFGPMEWLWRSLTYREWQTLKKTPVSTLSA
jgi:uncharacterized protein